MIQVEESIKKGFIVADEVCVNAFIDETQLDNYLQCIYCLIASYNAWNIDYPKCYPVLRFFSVIYQMIIMNFLKQTNTVKKRYYV